MTPRVTSFDTTLGMDPAELAKQVDVDALVVHCDGSVEAALDMYLNDQAQCREVAPPKGSGLLKQPGAAEEGAPAGLAAEADGDGEGNEGEDEDEDYYD